MKKSMFMILRDCAVVPFWKLYKTKHAGWRKEYADHILSYSANVKTWYRDLKELRSYVEQNYPGPLTEVRFHYWKLKYWFYKSFYGSIFRQDFIGQMRASYRHNRLVVTNGKTTFASKMLNSREDIPLCADKSKFAQHWAAWYGRNWHRITKDTPLTEEKLALILNETGRIVLKPLYDYGGKGVEIIDVVQRFGSREHCLSYLNQLSGDYIVEEYVNQTGMIREIHPPSVNTIRVVTVKHRDGSIEVLNAYLRAGRDGNAIDNISSGGTFFVVDPGSGTFRKGKDDRGHYIFVPKDATEMKIPDWDKVTGFCISAHQHAPEGLRYVGWDVCVSEEGLYMIEGNETPGLQHPYAAVENPWKKLKGLFDEYEVSLQARRGR